MRRRLRGSNIVLLFLSRNGAQRNEGKALAQKEIAMTSSLFKNRWGHKRRGYDDDLYSCAESRQFEESGVRPTPSERRDSKVVMLLD